jgi:hypothetical protein
MTLTGILIVADLSIWIPLGVLVLALIRIGRPE